MKKLSQSSHCMNVLSGQIDLSEADVQLAQEVWENFGCKTIGDYHNLYLESDALLLADAFEKFQKFFKSTYDLDPCHYYFSPKISWDAMLKSTGVKLELLSNIDMLLFCEKAIRGGLNGIGEKRIMKANNKYLSDFYQSTPSIYGLFLNVVNLYGGTMTKI